MATRGGQGALWVGSAGYERFHDVTEFAGHLAHAQVELLIDVRQLPNSRRRGFAKTALSRALSDVRVDYLHMRALGNPKPLRDRYKSGDVPGGRAGYREHVLRHEREALEDLPAMLTARRCALMCVERDPAVCHREVILELLEDELGLRLEIADLA